MSGKSQDNLLWKIGICLLFNGVILWLGAGFVFLNITNYYEPRLSQANWDLQEFRRLNAEQDRLLKPVSLLGSIGSGANLIGIVLLFVSKNTSES